MRKYLGALMAVVAASIGSASAALQTFDSAGIVEEGGNAIITLLQAIVTPVMGVLAIIIAWKFAQRFIRRMGKGV